MKIEGLIVLDIDGTITTGHESVPLKVVEALEGYVREGWLICLNTGRSLTHARKILNQFHFPLLVALQNGAQILHFPSLDLVESKYIDNEVIPQLDVICHAHPTDFVLYSGEKEECYYRPHLFEKGLLERQLIRSVKIKERWIPVESYENLPTKAFASIKCFGLYASANAIRMEIEAKLNLHTPMVKDPYADEHYVVLISHTDANKGNVIHRLKGLYGVEKVIAAGDDHNDLSMLKAASIAIAMEGAPQELTDIADIIAPSAKKMGIIAALKQAMAI